MRASTFRPFGQSMKAFAQNSTCADNPSTQKICQQETFWLATFTASATVRSCSQPANHNPMSEDTMPHVKAVEPATQPPLPPAPAPYEWSITKGLRFIESALPGIIHVVEELHERYAFGDRVGPAVVLKQEGSDNVKVVPVEKIGTHYEAAP